MQNVNFRRVFIISALLILISIYAALWARMITDPAERTGTDFIAFYAAGRIAREHGFSQVYDLSLQQNVEEEVLGFPIFPDDVNPFVHPPFILPVLSAISYWGYQTAFYAWGIFLLCIFVLSSWFFCRTLAQSRNSSVLFLGSLLFFPAFISILNGQDTAILVLGGALWLHGFTKEDDRTAGLGLALTTIRPHVSILLAVPFLFKRRKIFWWYCVGAGILALFSIALVKIPGTQAFIDILTVSASGEGYKINESAMFNFIGLLHRFVPVFDPVTIRLMGWGIYAAAFVGLLIYWVKSETIDARDIGLSVLVSLLAVPHLHYHDLALLLVPLFVLLRYAGKRLKPQNTLLFPLGLSILMLIGHVAFLRYYTPYLVILCLGIGLWQWGSRLKRAVDIEQTHESY